MVTIPWLLDLVGTPTIVVGRMLRQNVAVSIIGSTIIVIHYYYENNIYDKKVLPVHWLSIFGAHRTDYIVT